jgi:potassium/hydrogen antiporter
MEPLGMTVPIAFAFIGGVILIGFFANLLFRVTKIPSVLLLISIGVFLGPLTGWIASDFLISIAPFFGTLALLIILFEGGLELDIESALKQAPRAALLSGLVFILSFVSVYAAAHYIFHIPLMNSLVLAGILGASSPAICIPVVSGLSVRNTVKTILKLESALGDVLLIVTVLLLLDIHTTGGQGWTGMLSSLFISLAVAFAVSLVAGALWSRLIGWMGKEPLAYMLTLGFLFLLHFTVEELHGSAPLAVLMFGMMLANMHVIAGWVGLRARDLFGIDIRAEQFAIHEFMKNITEELSFLIRTFFFVYLGLLLDFRAMTPLIGISGLVVVLLLLGSRWLAVRAIRRQSRLSSGELYLVITMMPRGLATAVMAFLAVQQRMEGADLFPLYAFMVIVLTNILMTAGVIAAERRLRKETSAATGHLEPSIPETRSSEDEKQIAFVPEPPTPISGLDKLETEDQPTVSISFSDRMARLLGVSHKERELCYLATVNESSLRQPPFGVQIFLASVLTALGLVLNQSSIIVGAALIMPIAVPVLGAGLALAIGDIYLFLKQILKLSLVVVVACLICALFSALLPFNAVTTEIASRTRPTILDFLVALFAGMSGAALMFSPKKVLQYFPAAILALTLLPPLAVLGFGFGSDLSPEILRGAALYFTANFFATIFGAFLVYSAIGMPETTALPAISDWKRRELGHPATKLIFQTLRLENIVSKTGNASSRLIVIAIFLLALLIPLQLAFNQLSTEFRARQAISNIEKMFDVPGRSAIINSIPYIGENEITVRIQLATNAFFTSSDIERFEERVSDRTGKSTHLDLVQSLGDIGEGKKIGSILSQSQQDQHEYKPGVVEMTTVLQREVEKCLKTVALPPSMAVLRTSAELSAHLDGPAFRIDYISEIPLSEDARVILASQLERQMALKKGQVLFTHIKSRYEFNLDSRKQFRESEERQLLEIQDRLKQYRQLKAIVEFSSSVPEKRAYEIRTAFKQLAPILDDPSRTGSIGNAALNCMFRIGLQLETMVRPNVQNVVGKIP